MIYWSAFQLSQWDSLTESGWYYFDLDGFPTFYGNLYSSLQYENLQNYLPASSLYDNSTYDHLNAASGYALVTDLLATTNAKIGRLYKDAGADYYSGVFEHTFDLINYLPVGQYGVCDVWALSNSIGTEDAWNTASAQAVRLALNSGKLSLMCHENSSYENSVYSLSSGIQYSIKLQRSDTSLTAYTFDNPSFTGLALDDLSVTLPVGRNYRYFWPCNKPNYGSSNTGRISYLAKNYHLENCDWQGTMNPIIGMDDGASLSGSSTFTGLLNMISAMDGSLSGLATFGGALSLVISSGLDLYIRGMQQTTDYIPLYIYGANYTLGGSLPLYIGASGLTSSLYLYIKGQGTNRGYYPLSDYITLFVGNPNTTLLENSLPLYLDCAAGSLSSGLYLCIDGNSPLSSGLDLWVSGVGNLSESLKMYTHGY